jgi:hypothetical protein
MVTKTILGATVAAVAFSSAVDAQTSNFPTSAAQVGQYETPIVIFPASSIPEQTGSFESQQTTGEDGLIISVAASAVTELSLDIPTSQSDLLNIVAYSAFGASLDSVTESASDIEGEISELPATGTASFAGTAAGTLINSEGGFDVQGDVAIDVDFGAGKVDSTFTNMTRETIVTDGISVALGTAPWRDFSSSGSFVDDTSLFAGSAASEDGLLSGSVAGMINGTEGATGIWSLAGNGEQAIGGFSASAE